MNCSDIIHLILIIIAIIYPFGLSIRNKSVSWKRGEEKQKISDIDELISDSQRKELSIIDSLNGATKNDQYSYMIRSIRDGILYSVGRHDWYESQRQNILRLIFQLASVVFVVFGLIFGLYKDPNSTTLIFVGSAAFASLMFICLGLYIYNMELDGDRPYRLVSDIKIRYFRYNLSNESPEDQKTSRDLAVEEISKRESFIRRVINLSSVGDLIREDLEQLYILHVLQRSKQKSLSQLRYTLFNFTVSLIMLVVVSIIFFVINL